MTRKFGKHFCVTYITTEQLFWLYYVSSVVYIMISPTGETTQRPQNAKLKHYHWAIGALDSQEMQNQLVMLMRPNKAETAIPYVTDKCLPNFLVMVIQLIIWFLYLKRKMYIDILALEVIINTGGVYFQSSGEDMALEVTVSSVKSTDGIYKTDSGLSTAQLLWQVDLPSLESVVVFIADEIYKFKTAVQWFRMSHISSCRIFWSL